MKRILLSVLLLLSIACGLRAQTAPDGAELTKLLKDFWLAPAGRTAAMHERFQKFRQFGPVRRGLRAESAGDESRAGREKNSFHGLGELRGRWRVANDTQEVGRLVIDIGQLYSESVREQRPVRHLLQLSKRNWHAHA